MSAACPQCSAPDQSVAVPHALDPAAQPPLDEQTRALLAPPPPPQPAPHRMGGAAICFYSLAGVFALLAVFALTRPRVDDPTSYGTAYALGYFIGPFLLPALFAGIAAIIHAVSKGRHGRRAAESLPQQQAFWQRNHAVWQAAWLCRRCRVAFFPDGVLRKDFAASPPIPLDQFPLWVVTAAERAYGAAAPVAP
ncbi:hypothetical protein [Kitasatospora sp. NPDC093806]|uniref:hypothetical protein n=1 Tax=Kitasatospora sp. NPDC093806 TaxID=3155075 RepID=UPI00342102BB